VFDRAKSEQKISRKTEIKIALRTDPATADFPIPPATISSGTVPQQELDLFNPKI